MEGIELERSEKKHQRRCQSPFSMESSTWQQGLEPDLCRLRYQCEDMD